MHLAPIPAKLPTGRLALMRLLGVLAALVAFTGCSGLSALNALTPSTGYASLPDQPYGTDPRQRADVYVPAQAAPPGGFPVVVFFYGGNWSEGSRRDYRFVAQALASRGVLTVLPDYRLYPQAAWREILQDCAQATAWAQQRVAGWGGNPQRLTLAGHSAGAYNAAMLALDPRWLRAAGAAPEQLAGWAGLAGPYDFRPIQNPAVIPVFGGPNPPADSQPLHHAQARAVPAVPALLLAPADDKVVEPQRNSVALAEALRRAGVPVQLETLPHMGHAATVAAFAWPLRGRAPVLDRLSEFAKAHTTSPAARP